MRVLAAMRREGREQGTHLTWRETGKSSTNSAGKKSSACFLCEPPRAMQCTLLFMTPFANVLAVNTMILVSLPPTVRVLNAALCASSA